MYAAVIGAIILLVITFFIYPNDDQVAEVTCIAYVRGIEIRDKSKIMQLVAEQLSEMSIVSAEMTDEINNITAKFSMGYCIFCSRWSECRTIFW